MLWTNSAPTSSITTSTATLSQDVDNFNYIKFIFNYSTSDTTQGTIIIPVSAWKSYTQSGTSYHAGFIRSESSGNTKYCRPFWYNSDTQVGFGNCSKIYGTGTSATSCIPINIVGIKNGGGGTDDIPVLDYANPLHTFSSEKTYTTTQKCWLVGLVNTVGTSSTTLTIDGTKIYNASSAGTGAIYFIPLNAGSVITINVIMSSLGVYKEL